MRCVAQWVSFSRTNDRTSPTGIVQMRLCPPGVPSLVRQIEEQMVHTQQDQGYDRRHGAWGPELGVWQSLQ